MPLREGQWNLSYDADGIHPGADFTFGTLADGAYLIEPYEIARGDTEAGDAAMPRGDGIRLGQDWRAASTITLEVGVDAVDDASTAAGRHNATLERVSHMAQAWDAEAVRRRWATPAVLRTVQGGRARRFYGRPRKFDPVASKLTRQGYTPVLATFVCIDGVAYDDTEQTLRVDIAPPPHQGLVGPLTTPLSMTGPGSSLIAGEAVIGGTRPTWPVITIYGPVRKPGVRVVDRWEAHLNLTLKAGEAVTIDPRPWARTVLRDGASVAGLLYRSSPRLDEMRLPPGRRDCVLTGTDPTSTSYMTIAWRDAYAYL
ncbi:hypothetical protein [Streptomyces boncukensis]|uniref:Uncharacterized protein n=1 Tax=Streptomyces boncukensis TaxID=2711219 RepID=A0A6G4WTD6_9ACTN|nr:hypothetical protein [Streptomyces boncukensis]NGO67887.1 hypothetical protein [Streptomyces boncukensis]